MKRDSKRESGKKFDKTFKEQASRRIIDGGKTVGKMADELRLHCITVRALVRQINEMALMPLPAMALLNRKMLK